MPRPLSAGTKSLIESLYSPAPFRDRSTKDKLAILELIGGAGEPIAIPDLVPLLLDQNQDIAQAAANAVSVLSSKLSTGELFWLDQVMRERSPYRWWSYPSAWAELKPDQLDRLEGWVQRVFARLEWLLFTSMVTSVNMRSTDWPQ